MSKNARQTFFATCAPGLEPLLHAEARELKFAKVERQVGGVRFEGSMRDAWKANLHFRTAVRVLLRVSRFEAKDPDTLYQAVQDVDWRRFLSVDSRFVVSAQSKESALDHSLFVEQRTKDAIVDQFMDRDGARPTVDKSDPQIVVHVHLTRDRCTLSIDTSGASLHKRGWRRFQGQAPLSETLAAAILLLSDWDRRSPLVDPFCGSGTLLIEAALLARNIPAGSFRSCFAFQNLPGYDDRAYQSLRNEALKNIDSKRKLILRGTDQDEKTVRGAMENVKAAGLEDAIEIERGDARSYDFKPGWNAWIVTNPPYGERIGAREIEKLYAQFGELVRERCGGYRMALLSGNSDCTQALSMLPKSVIGLYNGAIPCELLRFEIDR